MSENFKFDAINIVGLLILLFNCFILVPLIIYGLYVFNKLKENDLIIYRNPFGVFLLNILVINALLTERNFVLFANVFCIIDVPAWSVHFYFALTWDAILYLKLIKVYYSYFQQQYNLSIAQKVWIENINPENDNSLWYVAHKHTYGNIMHLIKLGIPIWIFMSFTDGFTAGISGDIWAIDLIHLFEGLLPISIAFVILYRLRLVNDIYHIRNETAIALFMIGFSFIIYTIIFMFRHYDEYHSQSVTDHMIRLEALGNIFVTDGIAIACSILSTVYPVYLIKQRTVTHQNQNHINATLHTMNSIVSEYKTFTAFMSYLVSEYCPENLLFLVELIQCKHAYQKKNNYVVKIQGDDDKCFMVDFNINPIDSDGSGYYKTEKEKHFTYLFHNSGSIMSKLSLSENIPTTAILKDNPSHHLYFQMFALYEKYIKTGSSLELNISYSVREKLKNIFETNTKKTGGEKKLIKMRPENKYPEQRLFNVMDECAVQIVKLLQYSLSRFIGSDAFDSLSEMDLKNLTLDSKESSDAFRKTILNAPQNGVIKSCTS